RFSRFRTTWTSLNPFSRKSLQAERWVFDQIGYFCRHQSSGMKIAILGTRGIPNHYGGFEQFAEFFSVYLAQKGHEVYVYNSHNHPHQEPTFNGVNIIHCNDPEHKMGTFGQFIYDYNCIIDSRKRNFDIILQLGYTSNSIWFFLLPKKSYIVT